MHFSDWIGGGFGTSLNSEPVHYNNRGNCKNRFVILDRDIAQMRSEQRQTSIVVVDSQNRVALV